MWGDVFEFGFIVARAERRCWAGSDTSPQTGILFRATLISYTLGPWVSTILHLYLFKLILSIYSFTIRVYLPSIINQTVTELPEFK